MAFVGIVAEPAQGVQEMDNKYDSEKDAKISDSAYSNCSNSQSRRSRSSKSTHSGSNSSGSSGYGGKPSGSGSKIVPKLQKEKQENRKRAFEKPALLECRPPEPLKEVKNMNEDKLEGMDITPPSSLPQVAVGNISLCISQDQSETDEIPNTLMIEVQAQSSELGGFCCVISMQNGVVMYTTKNLSQILGFPKDMWIGKSFIDFLHPRDRDTFTSQITNSLAIQKIVKTDLSEQEEKKPTTDLQECKIACRIRCHRTLSAGYAVKNRAVPYVPFVLKLLFKDIKDDNDSKVYLIISATPLYPAYKSPNELFVNPPSFVIRHSATGALVHIDIESVPYLGYMPQDIHNQCALMMYHPDDLPLLKTAYEAIVKQGGLAKSMPYRIMAQNGDYVKIKTEWTSISNPWTLKLEFIIGKHHVLEGPTTTDVFKAPPPPPHKLTDEEKQKIEADNLKKENNLTMLKEVLQKPAETAKQQVTKRVEEIATIVETLLDEPKVNEEIKIDTQEADLQERDSVMLGAVSPHHDYDIELSSDTPLSYNQLNYNENLERYFNSRMEIRLDACSPPMLSPADTNILFFDQNWMAESFVASQTCMPQTAHNSTDPVNISSPSSMNVSTAAPYAPGYPTLRLTESMLKKHDTEMENELAKVHREGRPYKTDLTSDRQKTKKHLARCNASFNPTPGCDQGLVSPPLKKPHLENTEDEIPAKQPCLHKANDKPAPILPLSPTCHDGILSLTYFPLTEIPVIPKMAKQTCNADADFAMNRDCAQISQLKYHPPLMPSSFPQSIYRYSDFTFPPTMPLSVLQQQQQMMAYETPAAPIHLTTNKPATAKHQTEEAVPSTSFKILEPKPEQKPEPPKPIVEKEVVKTTGSPGVKNSITDEGSSYSSFYSTFVRTDSASISSDPKKPRLQLPEKKGNAVAKGAKKTPPREMDPPWSQDNETLNYQYMYQLPMTAKHDTMKYSNAKRMRLSQPLLVNIQLAQLYQNLKKDGFAPRLTLEEGITSYSSSSSGANGNIGPEPQRRKRDYAKLNLIYEENAPLPSPSASEAPIDEGPLPAPAEMENNTVDAEVPPSLPTLSEVSKVYVKNNQFY